MDSTTKKKYKADDLNIHTYGSGHDKVFIMYTDFEQIEGQGPRWYTRAYPDIRGNKAKATKQALKWLNEDTIGEPYIVRNSPKKILIQYEWGW